jgi:hypothetical protein
MLDWEITETDTLPHDEPLSSAELFHARRRFWGGLVAAVALVALAVFGVLRMRWAAGESALAADLLTLIKAEEQARRFNLQERVAVLLAEGTPDEWRYRYLALFDTASSATPVEVKIESVALDGISALVQTRIGDNLQRRHYVLTSEGWRRAPLPIAAWGDSLFTYTYPDNERIRMQYYREDREFARAVMADLPALMATRNALEVESLQEFSLVLTPQELSGVLLSATPTRLVLNSPQLVVLPLGNPLNSTEAVRAQIASVLLQDKASTDIADEVLPQNARFASSLRTILGLRWAVSAERYPQVREQWREQIGTQWQSPFRTLRSAEAEMDPSASTTVSSALLVADAIYERAGEAGIISTLQAMQTATGWDAVFRQSVGMTTLQLEAAVQGITPPPDIALPLDGTLLIEEGEPLALAVPNVPQPITLTRADERVMVQLPGGMYLPDACLPLFPHVQVKGTWREARQRLMVNELTVPTLAATPYFTVTDLPTQSRAVVGTWGASEQLDGLAALANDGTLIPILSQSQEQPFLFVTSAFSGAQGQALVLTTAAPPDCPLQWLIVYRPEQGIVAQWLMWWGRYPSAPTIIWDEASQSGLMVLENNRTDVGAPYWRLTPDNPLVEGEPDGRLPSGMLLGVRPRGEEVVVAFPAENDTPALVRRIHIKTQVVLAEYSAPEWMTRASNALFSHDGRYLFVTWNGQNRYNVNGEVSTILRYDMETGAEDILWRPADGNLAYYVVDNQAPVLYAITTTGRARAQLQRLGEASPQRLYQPSGDDGLSYIASCDNGGVMVVAFERTIQRSIADVPKTLVFLDSSGTAIGDPIIVESGMPLLCP